jgi:hypothetical protein
VRRLLSTRTEQTKRGTSAATSLIWQFRHFILTSLLHCWCFCCHCGCCHLLPPLLQRRPPLAAALHSYHAARVGLSARHGQRHGWITARLGIALHRRLRPARYARNIQNVRNCRLRERFDRKTLRVLFQLLARTSSLRTHAQQ